MVDKKAQGMSITTIILIVLGLVVLVVLILGFTTGWSNMKDWVVPSNNVQAIVDKCNIACATGSTYDYCTTLRELKAEGGVKVTKDCWDLANLEAYNAYGIELCPAITCDGKSSD